MPEMLTVPEVAPILRLSVRGAYDRAKKGTLPGVRRLGARRYLVSRTEFEAFVGAPVNAGRQPEGEC